MSIGEKPEVLQIRLDSSSDGGMGMKDFEMTLTLNSPITEEQWDMIADVDFDYTDNITFHTKHGKEVEFVKRKTGRWIFNQYDANPRIGNWHCSECGQITIMPYYVCNYCPSCGAKMEVEHD